MVKTNIDVKVHFKAKNAEVEEFELVMNTWRACMLFFEREMRKLNSKGKLSQDTLAKISKKLDFTDLLRLSFLSIKGNERMRLVKLDEVAEAIQKVQNFTHGQVAQEPVPKRAYQVKEKYSPQPTITEQPISPIPANPVPQVHQQEISSLLAQSEENLVFNESNYDSVAQFSKPDINSHASVLQRNTASAVIELRKMMYDNLQKIRNTLAQENE